MLSWLLFHSNKDDTKVEKRHNFWSNDILTTDIWPMLNKMSHLVFSIPITQVTVGQPTMSLLCWLNVVLVKCLSAKWLLTKRRGAVERQVKPRNSFIHFDNKLGWLQLAPAHFANTSFCQLVILSTCHFCQLVILPTCHFATSSFCQLFILSTFHFVNLSFCQLVILPTCHFANLSFCQLVILPTCHLDNLSFCQLVILPTCHFAN